MEGGVAYQPLLVSENYSDWAFVWYENIHSALFGLSQSMRVTDRWTDRIMTPKTVLA